MEILFFTNTMSSWLLCFNTLIFIMVLLYLEFHVITELMSIGQFTFWPRLGPVRLAETWLKTLFWLKCCERKTMFQLKKEAEQAGFKTAGRRSNSLIVFSFCLLSQL